MSEYLVGIGLGIGERQTTDTHYAATSISSLRLIDRDLRTIFLLRSVILSLPSLFCVTAWARNLHSSSSFSHVARPSTNFSSRWSRSDDAGGPPRTLHISPTGRHSTAYNFVLVTDTNQENHSDLALSAGDARQDAIVRAHAATVCDPGGRRPVSTTRNHSQDELDHARSNLISITHLHSPFKYQMEVFLPHRRPLPLQHVWIPRRVLRRRPLHQRPTLPRSLHLTST